MSPNRLAGEKSLYLRQHAENPVDWYPWGEEAFKRARTENKPILLSIGYSSCHWCHVMEKESFSDPGLAKIINENFIPVKVDREERPDVDEVYMRAVQLMTGTGGWPLTVFLTPDLKPFFGGTYFPPKRRGGMIGFDELLRNIVELWKKGRDGLTRSAEETSSILKQLYAQRPRVGELSYSPVNVAYEILVSVYDDLYGGFGGAPKFPMPTYLSFLNMVAYRDREAFALKMVLYTLEKMARGGIFDQLAGGFHRYATDRAWLIPHFEKMLYDNALLAIAYLEAYQLSGQDFLKEVAVRTLNWVLNDMESPSGGFFSSVDADSPEGEGIYYTWTASEVKEILGEEMGELICKLYSVTPAGNFEKGRTVLTLPRDPADLASKYGIPLERIEEARQKLLSERERRPRPRIDEKIIASWNGLAISALSKAYQVLYETRYLESAIRAAERIISRMWDGKRLRRTLYGDSASNEGTLEDYSYLAQGLLDLFESAFEPRFFRAAVGLVESMIDLFWDPEEHGFFYSVESVGGISRIKYGNDNVMPSGNSVAALTLLRLYEYTGEARYLELVEKTLQAFNMEISNTPAEYTTMLRVLTYYLSPRTEIVIVGDDVKGMLKIVHSTYHPLRALVAVTPENSDEILELISLARGKEMVDGKTAAYICENYTCRFPVTSSEELRKMLSRGG
jgi:uncharacterized protein YyaL (SSP411 family)